MLPLFPSNLDPTIIGSIMNGSTSSNNTNEENEISELEQEHTKFFQELERIASDIPPLGKLNSEQQNDSESSNEGSNDNSEDSDDDDSNGNNSEGEVTVNY